MDEEILAYQRAILAGLLIESYIPEENNERLRLIEEIISSKSHLFLPAHISILKKALTEIETVRADGCYECWIISEAFIHLLNENEKSECIEILSTGALEVNPIKTYLGVIAEKILLRKVI
ncbi:hypothetical protein JCM11957_07010 [Caminibacter profundus]